MEFDTDFFPDTLEAWQLISIFFCWGAALPPSFLANKPKNLGRSWRQLEHLTLKFAVNCELRDNLL